MRSVRLPFSMLLSLLLTSCADHEQMRTTTLAAGHFGPEICRIDNEQERSVQDLHCALEHHWYVGRGGARNDYYLAFVEFDDQGWFWDRKQMEALLRFLYDGNPDDPATGAGKEYLMFVFAHGWKHGASPCDTNVLCFQRMLERLDLLEREMKSQPRKVVGVYIGWRGLSDTSKNRVVG